ncbi:chemotaxis protein CheW [Pseudoalteromonas sp. CST5]|uniref:chemotaxis protein CheW n=1 Tax=unclassified Pseudoalteromonas TaxID=194690 RepID=UPI00235A0E05|nr:MULTISPECIES: chemotaxis protein CheW [unclassified Pseudoalteromonas]MDC9513492.1 chemotaxis protein CheW [Pseudoalteromonas sp. CST1]MDC9537689.1 chemotaxis protein CheW [Pseudoalteromonas sp. CST3]MDC9541933.1 chemotaxis protein CheW [Pseudoalteromonas sp. CST2]MDC9544653.1 chemotaxis protein CheW [Pseudoalteromonas sp. CST4]MDC9549403.1 chemotaxis protein CheW [Pseudoalteromonas sp. CST5]
MSKQLFANEKVMTQYLGALLCEDEPEENLEPVAKLLEQVPSALQNDEVLLKPKAQLKVTEQLYSEQVKESNSEADATISPPAPIEPEPVETAEVQTQLSTEPAPLLHSQEDYFEGEFQALFFEVAGLTLAVPLKALGGIHQLGEVNHLFGKPKWFKGVMLNRDEKLNVVDTARWVMPEKYDEKLEASLNYQYLITLGDSNWGLLAEKLINNITLSKEDVKWRKHSGKRPWLAGVIKEKMCALIDVDNLNALLEEGLDSRQ